MTDSPTIFLMYHELEEAARALCQADPGYVRYVLRASEFRSQMDFIRRSGWTGRSVSEALDRPESAIALTFDDGSESDLICAAPVLKTLGFSATFYITAGFIGKRGYLSSQQLRELCGLGFEIGCHSMTHAYLTDLDEKGLQFEIADSKVAIEQMISKAVEHFSCPGGRYDRRVAEMARASGYQTVATSRIQANFNSTNRFALGRVAIMRDTTMPAFADICSGRSLRRLKLQVQLRESVQRVLGNSAYDRLRSVVLRRNSISKTG